MTLTVVFGMVGCGHPNMKQLETELEIKKDINVGIILDTTQPLQLSIPIKNRADRVITIQNVSKDCSCTSVKIDRLTIAPGDTATLQVVANLTGKTNVFVSDIIIESDAIEKIDEIQIKGQITGQIRIRPVQTTVLTGDRRLPGNFLVFSDDQDGKWKYEGFSSEDPALTVQLKEKETTPTTSVYDGTVDIKDEEAKNRDSAYRMSIVTLKFSNEHLGKSLDLNYPVEVAVRRRVTVDPAQVTFIGKGGEQTRTVLVQSSEAINLDAVKCDSPGIKTAIHRIDGNSLTVNLLFSPADMRGESPASLGCDLISDGKTVGNIPISIVEIP